MAIDARAVHRLEAMDIQVWHVRGPRPGDDGELNAPPPDAVYAGSGENASAERNQCETPPAARRIRLEAGSGRWLLVVADADRARHATLIEDIRAALGADECRFGTWSDSPESGVAAEDWAGHGIRHVLVFSDGSLPGPGFVQCGAPDRLASSGEARRALWVRLRPLLAA